VGDADEDTESAADLADRLVADTDGRPADPLNDRPHQPAWPTTTFHGRTCQAVTSPSPA
jgi:hypothetical protein